MNDSLKIGVYTPDFAEIRSKILISELFHKMTTVADTPFIATGDLSARPDRSLVEQRHQALASIESELCRKLKAIASPSCPPDMDEVHWESARVEMETQAKKDAEKEKLPYEDVVQLSEQYQIYKGFMLDEKTLPANPTENTVIFSDDRTSEFQEAEKKIAAVLHQDSGKSSSLKLDLSGLLLHSVPDEIMKLSSTLVKLDLSNNNLEILPESVTSLVNLTHLDIKSNQLTSLPDSIGRLGKLKVFNVSGNSLAALPDRIESCRALEELMANFNQLTRLPEGLGFELLNLRKLCVNSNKLTHLPYSTSHMMCLRYLDVHMNRLGGLPEDLENLMNLEYLDLSSNFNYLVALPESIGGLTSLIELNISYNQITALPESIGRLEKLQFLKVEGNPLVVPPPEVIDQSVDAIKEYMASRFEARREGMKSGRESWLGRIASGKWVRCRMPSSEVLAGSLSWQELRTGNGDFSSVSTPSRGAFLSPRRLFSPRNSSLTLCAFTTPRRTSRHVYSEVSSNTGLFCFK